MVKQAPPTPPTHEPPAFDEAYGEAIHLLRGAIETTVRHAGGDPERPQVLSREFGLNKNLTWKVSRLIGSDDPIAALRFIPGAAGIRKVREAFAPRAGAEAIALLDRALERFDRMVEVHAGDRSSLELLVQGAAHDRVDPETHETARRMAFQGNSAIWGVQARAQHALRILAPNADDPDWVDVASIGTLHDFRRMRGETSWLLFTSQSYEVGPGNRLESSSLPLVEPPPGSSMPLMTRFCTDPLPDVVVSDSGKEKRFELPPGPIGNLGQMTCCYGMVDRKLGRRAMSTPSPRAELGVNLLTPVEHVQIDIMVHDRLGWDAVPSMELYSRMEGADLGAEARQGRSLPFTEPLLSLGRGAKCLSSSIVPRNVELAEDALETLELDPGDFRVWRFSMAYPPIPTTLIYVAPIPAP